MILPSLYLRTCCPRKSNPASTWVMLVFSGESSSPRSFRHVSTSGWTSCSSNSLELPVMMKSSAHRIRFTLARRLWTVALGYFSLSFCSRPSRVRLAKTGETTPPTKLQTFFFGIRISKVRIDPKHDIDLILRDFHPLDQRPDQVPLTCPVGCPPSHRGLWWQSLPAVQ